MDFTALVKRKVIDLGLRILRDGDLDVLAKVLRESKVLEELRLQFNLITLADGKFTDALAENCTLHTLILHHNRIDDEGAKRLADALKRNNSLEHINLDRNQIGVEGGKRLAAAIVANGTLNAIRLSDNKIGDVGVQSLAASLLVNGSLKEMYLSGNGITDKGGKSLANALRCNCTIKPPDYWLSANRISEGVMKEIGGILQYPRRDRSGVENGALNGMMQSFIEEKNDDIARLKREIAIRDEELASKDKQIASLKAPFDQMKTIMETIDLSSGRNKTATKRPREEESNLATIQRKNQKIACIKQEKTGVEERLANVIEEKEATEAELEEVRGDLDIEKETVEHQLRATDVWHRRFDELARRAESGPVDGAVIVEIRNRSLAGGS